jgi:23S rRNA U2552 (ribose-2'-O)-methylase RlmE/FtsJ
MDPKDELEKAVDEEVKESKAEKEIEEATRHLKEVNDKWNLTQTRSDSVTIGTSGSAWENIFTGKGFTSRKFLLVIISMALLIILDIAKVKLDPDTLEKILYLIFAYVGVEGARDVVAAIKKP